MSYAKTDIQESSLVQINSLREMPQGCIVNFVSLSKNIPINQKEHLAAYGFVDGKKLWIKQHNPVTVIEVDFMEIALEAELAKLIFVSLDNQK